MKAIRQYERINKKIYRQKMSVMFNEISINEEMLPKYTYIVIHRQTCFVLSELFSEARQARFPKLGSKPGWLKSLSKILLLSHKETSANEGNLNAYVSHLFLFTYIQLTATESSIHLKSLALRSWQPFTSLARELKPTGVGEHIYAEMWRKNGG